ncbi:hypothetical protein CK203_106250 [Vitis vinifera]|uniref:Uncharacterized protein n=1 Tax=Vitis vinifera TaxID=29760 RepID=A0A438FHF7_VITVI|nr:hypothetical protein CK203_106250 [Vitis vinifera]
MESAMAPSAFTRTSRAKGSPSCSIHFSSSEPVPEQHHLMPHLLFLLPQSRPSLSLVRVPCLARFFSDSDHTTQTAIMERMDHFQIQQDQQTLILREIQQHLGLVPPAPPVAVPSSVPAEDPSYPPEEPTT